jgi:hypothetical protein
MHVTSFLRLAAIVTSVLGVGLMLSPAPILAFFAGGQVPNDVHFVRFLGTALIGFGALNWTASKFKDASALRPALYGNAISLILGVAVDAVGLLTGTLSHRGWWILLLHVIFGVGFMYYVIALRKPPKISGRPSRFGVDQPE